MLWLGFSQTIQAQCTSGCNQTYTLNSATQTLSFTVGGANQIICIVKDPSLVGNATITSGTLDVNNRPNTVFCFGPGVVVGSGVSINNQNNQFSINNFGLLQNSLTLSQNQQVINNYGIISGPVSISSGTINNMSGGTFSSSNFTFNGGSFANNAGSSFNIPNNFTAGSGATFSGSGSFEVGGSFQTNNGSSVSIGGSATITGSVTTNTGVTFGSTLAVGGSIQANNNGPITVTGATTVGGNVTSNAAINFNSSLAVTGNVQSNNSSPISVTGAATIGGTLQTNATTTFSASLSVSGAVQVNNGGPLTVTGAATLGSTLQTNATTNFGSTLSVAGAVQVNNGGPLSATGATNIGGNLNTNANTSFGSTLGVGGNLQVNNGGPLTVGSNLSINGSAQLNANVNVSGSLTLTNAGNTNPALQVNNGSANTFGGGGSITGNFTNNGSVSFAGSLSATGTITNNNGGTITSSSGGCKTLCGSAIVNNGTISSTSGPTMNLCTTPSGSGTQTNTVTSITPTANVTALSAIASGSVVNATFTAASPAPGGYIVLRKASPFVPADLPVDNNTYSLGNTIGGATVVALLSGSATSFSYSSGCGSFYFAVISSSNNSGSCGIYRTSSYTTTGPVSVTCSGNRYWISSTASNWNNVNNWSTTSGGAPGASVPASGNLAIFDNARNGNCTIDATVDVQGIQVSGYTGTITQNANPMTLGSNGYSQTSGTFTGGSASISISNNGLFSLSGGTFTSTSGTTTISGGFSANSTLFNHSAGTFNHNNGAWVFNPGLTACANPTLALDVIPATQFFNLELNGIAGCGINCNFNTGAGDVVLALNNLTHTDGIVNGQFAVRAGLIIGAGADGGTGTITVNGTGAQTYTSSTGRTCQLVVNKSSGAFTPSGGTTDLYAQSFSLTAGIFTAPSGTLNVGGPWGSNVTIFNHAAGTFTHNNGTVEINPNLIACANPTFTINVIPATAFYAFIINGISGCGINANITTAAGDVVACSHNFTHSDGIISGAFSFQNNLIINAGADGGTGSITANGSGAQTYFQSSVSPRTCQLIVNKSSGALTPAPGCTELFLQGFQQLAGNFTAPTGTLNVGGQWGSNVTIFSHQAGTFSHNNGIVEVNPSLIACANPTFTIDVIPATLFSEFVINGMAGCGINANITTASGDVVQANSDFTHADGIISGNFAFRGNLWITNGADGGTGTLTANGTGGQTYFQTAGTPRTCQLWVNKSSGDLTPAVGATNLWTQGFTQLTGNFTAPTGTLNIGGPWGSNVTIFSHQAGTFSHNNGTVEFNPNLISCANPTFTIDVISSTLLNNFVVNGIAGCGINATVTTASGDVVQGAGDFTHTDGIISGNFAFRGNLNINAGADGGTGTITANGTGAQTYFQATGTTRTCQLIVTKPAGSLSPTSGTTDLLIQGFTLNSGSFTAPTSTLNVGGNWGSNVTIFSHQGGTFLHNNGTVEFNPTLVSCANPTFTFDVNNGTQLFNFRINGISGCGINANLVTAAGDTLDVLNNLTYNDGICNGMIETGGNVTVTSPFDGGTGRLIFKGANLQNFDLSGATNLFDGPLVMNKASNSVTLLSTCQLDAASQSITWNGGVLNTTSANLLIIGNNVTSGPGSNSSFANGPVRKIGNQAFTFPTGKGTKFGQLYMTAPSVNTDQFTAEYFGTNPNISWNVSSKENSISAVSSCEYWTLNRDAGTSNVSVRLSWDNSRSCPVTNINEQRVGQWIGSQWINQGTNGMPTGNTTAGTVQSCGALTVFGSANPLTNITSGVTSISYAGSPFCTSTSSPQPITFSGISGGMFTASPAGLTLDASTGSITPSTSAAGTYTVTYTVSSSVSCANVTGTTTVVITNAPSATIAYPAAAYCISNATSQNVTRTGPAGGTYSVSPSGLSINAASGAFTPSTSTAGTYVVTYTIAASGGCSQFTTTATVTITPVNSATISYTGSPFCTASGPVSVNFSGTAGGTFSATAGLTIDPLIGQITPATSTGGAKTITYAMAATGGCPAVNATTSVTINVNPVVAALTGFQNTCVGSTTTFTTTTGGGVWSTSNPAIATVSAGVITGVSAGTASISYTVTTAGCATSVTRTANVVNPAPGTPGVFGNGLWNAYVYNSTNWTNYHGFYTTGPGLSYNTTSDFANNAVASTAPTYSGCNLPSQNNQSIRLQRTNFTSGTYQIGVLLNDDNLDIILDGTTIYSSAYSNALRTNVWTGTLSPSSQLELRFTNTGGGQFELNFSITPVVNTPPNPGTISGNQVICSSQTPIFTLANGTAPTAGTCSNQNPVVQWESSTNNISFSPIAGANANSYTIPGPLSQTTYYRRAYRTWCETVYSNTVTVTVFSGPQGTPGVFGNGFWNAYVYNSMDFSTGYSGFYTTGTGLNYNSTTDYTNSARPSTAPTYQGCQIGNTQYSIRYQRTGFTWGRYQIDIPYNDDDMQIILDGNVVYNMAGFNPNPRTNVWTGTLEPASQLEIRFFNNNGPGEIQWNFTLLPTVTASLPGTISGNQSVCVGSTPTFSLTNVSAATQGTCTQNQNPTATANLPYQWQSSLTNTVWTNISGANATSYTIPGPLAATTYFRRIYRTYCDTTASNVVTVNVYNGAQGDPNQWGNGQWNAYVFDSTDFTTRYSGFYTSGPALSYNSTTDYANTARPSTAASYQGCQVGNTNYSIRLKRTNFPEAVYRLGFTLNDDNVFVFVDGVQVYTSAYNNAARTNVWTGTLKPSSQVEIRYLNNAGPGEVSFTFTEVHTPVASSPGSISGTQSTCAGQTPPIVLGNTTPASAGSCTQLITNPYQWQSSTDNITFSTISGANLATYTIPGPLSETTYFRRLYRTFCDTLASNVITVSVVGGPQGTPGVHGNGLWNAYVYSGTDYSTGYSGYFTTSSGLNQNTTSYFGSSLPPSYAPTYLGCQIAAAPYSVRFQRIGIPFGLYSIGIARNDDQVQILIDGVVAYTAGTNGTDRPTAWVGTIYPTTLVEIRYNNTGGPGDLSFYFNPATLSVTSSPGMISGNQGLCTGQIAAVTMTSISPGVAGTCTQVSSVASVAYQWQMSTDNVVFANISGANAANYTHSFPLTTTTYFRRVYRTYCDTVYSNVLTATVSGGPQGTPGLHGNGFWNAYVYSGTDYATGYSGYFTTGTALNQNSTSYYIAAQSPSHAPSYLGCQIPASPYSVRFQRTNIPFGLYSIGISRCDDNVQILIDGVVAYSGGISGADRPNVWVGTIYPSTLVEIRYNNTGGPGDINFYFNSATFTTAATPGSIAGNQSLCAGQIPATTFSQLSAGVAGSCTQVSSAASVAYQWQLSTDNILFTNISGANAASYTHNAALAVTTYFRRVYRTYCDTVVSNVVTATVYGSAQGTPNTFGNGQWNAYVYNSTDYSTNYSGFYTTGSGLTYNSLSDFANNRAPSQSPNYQGCQVSATSYSVRYQRTGFPLGIYRIGVDINDDGMDIILNGVTVYSVAGNSGTVRANVWTGTLGANSNLEIRYRNTGGVGQIFWNFTMVTNSPAAAPGSIGNNQAVCSSSVPAALTNVAAATVGTCTPVSNPYQWQISSDNISFSNITGANAVTYTIPSALSATRYYRRLYRTYCDTVISNAVTISITTLPTASISYTGNPFCSSISTPVPVNLTGTTGGVFTAPAGLNLDGTTGAILPFTSTGGTRTVTYTIAPTGGCPAVVATTSVTITTVASISYAGSPYCTNLVGAQGVTRLGITGGTYSVSPSGLTINTGNGNVTPSSSVGNTYTVTYSYPASGGCAAGTTTASVVVTTLPTASISYAGNPFCQSISTHQNVNLTGTAGGSFSSGVGLSLNAGSGSITPSASTAGSYTVTYTIASAGGCPMVSATTGATITSMPSASISYSGNPWCQSAGGNHLVTLTGTAGGTFTAATGLSINPGTGTINAAASSSGVFTVTYSIAASGGCPHFSTNTSVTMNADVTFPSTPAGTLSACLGGSPLAYTTSASNATGYQWSVTGLGNSISGTGNTGTVTWDPVYSGTAIVSVSSLGCGGPKGPVSATVTIHPGGQWLGLTNNWNSASNWCGGIPTFATDVIIPTGASNMPQINSASFVNNLTLQPGSSLVINGSNSLSINGVISGSGIFTPGTTSTVSFDGSGPQDIPAIQYGNLSTSGNGIKTFASGSTTRISGNFSPSGSSHLVTGSTIEFNGTSGQGIPAFQFNNLTISGNSTKTLLGNVLVDGNAVLTNGTLALSSGTLNLGGNISGSGNLAGTCASALTISGTGATGTLNFVSGSQTLGMLNLSKSASGSVTLGSDLTICSSLNLSVGKIILGSNNLILLSGATTTSGNQDSYVQTLDQMNPTGAGFFIQEIPTGGGELIFPVGTAESYTPAYLDNIGFTRNFRVRVFNNVFEHGTHGLPVVNLDYAVLKTWEIEPIGTGGTPDVNIKLQWNTGDEGIYFANNRQNDRIYMGKNTGIGNGLWTKLLTDEKQLSTSPFTLTTARVTTFSKFGIGSDEQPLPVNLGKLTVEATTAANVLRWQTYMEKEALGFEILKSPNGVEFEQIGFVYAKGTAASYQFADKGEDRNAYYKIRFLGKEAGDITESNTVVIRQEANGAISYFPNPVETQCTLAHTQWKAGDVVDILISDLKGAIILQTTVLVSEGKVQINMERLPAGIYLIEAFTQGERSGRQKVVKL